MLDDDNKDGWVIWGRHVLETLKSQSAKIDKLGDDIIEIKTSIARLEVKSGIWGAMGGLIPVIIAMIIYFITQ